MKTTNEQLLDPWFSIWTKPRATIQQIIDTDPKRMVLIITCANWFWINLERAGLKSFGDEYDWPMILLISALISPIWILWLYIWSVLLLRTGKWLGGKSSSINIRAAIAWSSIPIIWLLLLLAPEIALFGREMFTSESPIIDSSSTLTLWLYGLALFEFIIWVWSMTIFVKCLSQVQEFSSLKAMVNIVLSLLVFSAPFIIFFLLLVYAS